MTNFEKKLRELTVSEYAKAFWHKQKCADCKRVPLNLDCTNKECIENFIDWLNEESEV